MTTEKKSSVWRTISLVYLFLWIPAFIAWKFMGIDWAFQLLGFIGLIAIVVITSLGHKSSRERYAEAIEDEEEDPPPPLNVSEENDAESQHRRAQRAMNLDEWNTNDGASAPAQRREQ